MLVPGSLHLQPACLVPAQEAHPAHSSSSHWLLPAAAHPCRLVLEDDSARIALCGDALPVGECVTGVVVALRGRCQPNGDFEVADLCFAGMAPQQPLPAASEDK